MISVEMLGGLSEYPQGLYTKDEMEFSPKIESTGILMQSYEGAGEICLTNIETVRKDNVTY
jgi:hypothetical protein